MKYNIVFRHYNRAYAGSHLGKNRARGEDDYFEEAETEDPADLEYIPAPDSPSHQAEGGGGGDSDSDDPLDAFMQGIDVCCSFHAWFANLLLTYYVDWFIV